MAAMRPHLGLPKGAKNVAQELAESRAREAQLRELLRVETEQHGEDVRRLEVRLGLDAKANKLKAVEAKLRSTRDELANARVDLETAASTESALRSELAVLALALRWHEHPELRRAAESAVHVQELNAAYAQAAERAGDAEARVDEVNHELDRMADELQKYTDAYRTLSLEKEKLEAESADAKSAMEENAALRTQLSTLDAAVEAMQSQLEDLSPQVPELKTQVERYRVSWQECRKQIEGHENELKAAHDETLRAQRELQSARLSLAQAERRIEVCDIDIANLRRQEARWTDEHMLLAESQQELLSTAKRLGAAEAKAAALQNDLEHSEKERQRLLAESQKTQATLDQIRHERDTHNADLLTLQGQFEVMQHIAGHRAFDSEVAAQQLQAQVDRLKEENRKMAKTMRELERNNETLQVKQDAIKHESVLALQRSMRSASAMDFETIRSNLRSRDPIDASVHSPRSHAQVNGPPLSHVTSPTTKHDIMYDVAVSRGETAAAAAPDGRTDSKDAKSHTRRPVAETRVAHPETVALTKGAWLGASRVPSRAVHENSVLAPARTPPRPHAPDAAPSVELSPETPVVRNVEQRSQR
jgi:chromosome segregation ATPase